ncbi:hypothetical protein ACIHQR_05750 [Corallococcus coralloides]|uniref:hypothetical protein n=1 Tax=Corallococcus coralloides TaxID=184914 RepID=UPI00384F62E8
MSSLRALALLAALSLAPSSAGAQTQSEQPSSGVDYVFATVDAYTVGHGTFHITGTLVNESTPRTIRFWTGGVTQDQASTSAEASRCDRLALVAMTRPGRYLFTSKWTNGGGLACTLTRQ